MAYLLRKSGVDLCTTTELMDASRAQAVENFYESVMTLEAVRTSAEAVKQFIEKVEKLLTKVGKPRLWL